MDWFRWHNHTASDPKWRAVARRSGAPVPVVVAVWAALCENANQSPERGTLANWSAEDTAAAFDLEPEVVEAIIAAMQGKVLDGDRLTGWERRNPKREDETATDRKRRQRARSRTVTHSHAPDREIDRDREEETTPSIHLSAGAPALDDDQHVSLVIRLANRGMSENPQIDPERFRPILPQHGESRQVVADWRAAGIDWPTIEATVYERATRYRPSERYRQIDRLNYFTPAVMEAHEKRAALDVAPPELPTEEQAAKGFQFLAGDPGLQEWAARLDSQLRAALEDSQVLKAELEGVRANLRRLNEQDRDFTRMKSADQESFLWVRLLNWYGERIGDPRPSGRRLAAVPA